MVKPTFDPEQILGFKITSMDRQELCEFVSALCRTVSAEVGPDTRRGGIYPQNISIDEQGGITLGPEGRSPWAGQEMQFIAPELYWNGELSPASDVYSVGMLLYYAVSGGSLPFEESGDEAQAMRMSGADLTAPEEAGDRLGLIIEKALCFCAEDRYQSLDEMRAELDEHLKELYQNEDAEDTEEAAEAAAVLPVAAVDAEAEKTAEETAGENAPEAAAEPEEGVKVYDPAAKNEPKEIISRQQSELLAEKFRTVASPAVPKMFQTAENDLEPVIIRKDADGGSAVYTRSSDRERKIAEEVKKRRRRPFAVILVLCAVLVMVAIVMNAMLKDFQEAKDLPDNVIETIAVDPYAASMPPIETPEITGAFGLEDLELNEDGIPTAGHDETKDPVLSTTQEGEGNAPAEHSYQVFKADISWTDAQKACAALGGHLVVISDQTELDEIIKLAEEAGITRIWIGCHRENGTDVWENGGTGYLNWAKGEPTYVDVNDQVAEDYYMLWNNRGWACNDNRDDPCKDYPEFYSGTMGYICEFGD